MHSASQDPQWTPESIRTLLSSLDGEAPGRRAAWSAKRDVRSRKAGVTFSGAADLEGLTFAPASGDGGHAPVRLHPQSTPPLEHAPQVLRLLYAAYVAGKEDALFTAAGRILLPGLLEALGASAMLCDTSGTSLHETARLSDLLSRDLDADHLRSSMRALAQSLGLEAAAAPGPSASTSFTPRLEPLQTRLASYCARAFRTPPQLQRDDELVVVSLGRVETGGDLPPAEAIQCRFGLTKQQTRIAFFLAERRSDKEIAEVLSISPFTVRRHVEEVLDKLEIHSRREVAGRLKEAG